MLLSPKWTFASESFSTQYYRKLLEAKGGWHENISTLDSQTRKPMGLSSLKTVKHNYIQSGIMQLLF